MCVCAVDFEIIHVSITQSAAYVYSVFKLFSSLQYYHNFSIYSHEVMLETSQSTVICINNEIQNSL